MDFERVAKGHFRRDFAISVTNPLMMFFEKLRELGFGDAVVRGLERLPNFFAASKGSGIISPGFMTQTLFHPSNLPMEMGL
jgi:hypothetical protein